MSSQLTADHARAVTGGYGRGPRGQLATLGSGVSYCPIPGCENLIDLSRLMCRAHWYVVPKVTRDLVWATWRSGQGALSSEHKDAVLAAIAAVRSARRSRRRASSQRLAGRLAMPDRAADRLAPTMDPIRPVPPQAAQG